MELARAGLDVTVPAETEAQPALSMLFAREPADVGAHLRITGPAPSGFGAAVCAELGGAEEVGEALSRVRGAVETGGVVVLAVDASRLSPSALAGALAVAPARSLVHPESLRFSEGLFVLAGVARAPDAGAWEALTRAELLLSLAEAALADSRARAELRIRHLEAARRAFAAFISRRPSRAEADLRAVRLKLADRERALQRVFGTTIYRVGRAMVSLRTPSGATALSKELLRAARRRVGRFVPVEEATHPGRGPGTFVSEDAAARDGTTRRRELDGELERWLGRISREGHERFVVMFSGTKYMQKIRANRPLRLTRILLERGIPVYFNYHGAITDPDRSNEQHPLLFQAPVDYTTSVVAELATRDLGVKERIFIVSYPHRAVPRFLNRLNAEGWVTLYDCRDDWEEFARVADMGWYERSVEKFVVCNTDVTFCVSRPLQEKIRGFTDSRDVRLSPNAYDRQFLAPGWVPARGSTIKIGYFGHLTSAWFDWRALAEIARARPDYLLEIVGDGGPEGVEVPANVRLLGPKDHAEICALAREWHAGIIPFKVGKLADAVDPIKIYEYFALQLPVVSFRMPQIDDYPYTRTVETVPAFVEALDAAVAERCDPEVFRRFLAENTWERRTDDLLRAAGEVERARRFEKSLHEPREAPGRR